MFRIICIVNILPCSPYGFFNSVDFFIGNFGESSPFASGEFSLVLQDEPDQQGCPAIRHVHNIENCAKGSIESGKKSDLVSQIAVDGFLDAPI